MKIDALVDPSQELTNEEIKRYARHILLPEIGSQGQQRIKNAKVLVIGAGGLGSPVLLYLAGAGVGEIGICEFDVVEESNLQRQIIHSNSKIGQSKAQSAKEKVLDLNPLIKVNLHEEKLTSKNALNIIKNYDLVIDGTDNFATRYLINDACVLLNKPFIWGSIYRFDGQLSVFWKKHGPCYRCLHPTPPPSNMVPSCATGGVLGSMCATIGSLQVTQALAIITGMAEVLIGEVLSYAAVQSSFNKIKISKDHNCVICGNNPSLTELIDYEEFCNNQSVVLDPGISVSELAKMLAAKKDEAKDFLLVDVREESENKLVNIAGSVLINKDDILSGEKLNLLPLDKPVVLYCRSGSRSNEVLAYLRHNGYLQTQHLAGGILAWIKEMEPTKPTY